MENLNRNTEYYIHKETTNKSFIDMHNYLIERGVINNSFFLALYDTDLANINPFDKDLEPEIQSKILVECTQNIWYYLREVIRIPLTFGSSETQQFKLNRGNLAAIFCMVNSINSYVELPAETCKSISISSVLSWYYLVGTTDTSMDLLHVSHNDSMYNMKRILGLIRLLPRYLQICKCEDPESLAHSKNTMTNNLIVTKPSPKSRQVADVLGRGITSPIQWFDTFSFMEYNNYVYVASLPTSYESMSNAAKNGKPNFKVITSVPGDIKTPHGEYAYIFSQNAAPFNELIYDMSISDIKLYLEKMSLNDFMFIRFEYKELGYGQEYFDRKIKNYNNDYAKIKREILLDWGIKKEEN